MANSDSPREAAAKAPLPKEEKRRLQAQVDLALASEDEALAFSKKLFSFIRPIFSPVLIGKENLPTDKPFMLVFNHTVYVLDALFITSIPAGMCDQLVYGLAEKIGFSNADFGKKLNCIGAVEGHPYTCSALMKAGVNMAVAPGGAREVFKPASEKYELKWENRMGFIRMATEHGYTIVPCAHVGTEELFDRYMERDEFADSRIAKWIEKRLGLEDRPDFALPIPKGLFGTLLPKPQRIYMSFGEPIDYSRYQGKVPSKAVQKKLQGQVAEALEKELSKLLLKRTQERHKQHILRRMLTSQ